MPRDASLVSNVGLTTSFCIITLPELSTSSSSEHGAPTDPFLLWPKGWMDQDTTWYGGRHRPRRRCAIDRDSDPPTEKGTVPTFRPTLLWHGQPSQLLWNTCIMSHTNCYVSCFLPLLLLSDIVGVSLIFCIAFVP